MEKTILTGTQVVELTTKQYELQQRIEEEKCLLLTGGYSKVRTDIDNYSDNNYDEQMRLVRLVQEKAEIDGLLSDYELAEPIGNKVGIGSVVSYIILNASASKTVGKEFNAMIVQKNYSGARPEGYKYISEKSSAGAAFYGTETGSVVNYAVDNGNQFEALVTEVNNNFCMQNVPSRQKNK